MTHNPNKFEFPKQIERCLAALSKLYHREGKHLHQEILVNSQARLHEGWSADNWNGGTYGHALYLDVPEALFLQIANKRKTIQKQIKEGLNSVHNIQNEFIQEVFLEMAVQINHDWRVDSGFLRENKSRPLIQVVS